MANLTSAINVNVDTNIKKQATIIKNIKDKYIFNYMGRKSKIIKGRNFFQRKILHI